MKKIIKSEIEKIIYIIRGQKVMLDSDLAELYGVETKYLNRQVKRNQERFPPEFMFKLNKIELESLRCQFVTLKSKLSGRKYLPYVFNEYGIAMLSGVLNSKEAVSVNIGIIKTFIKLRKFVTSQEDLADKVTELEAGTNQMFRVVFERLDNLEAEAPVLPNKRKKIGFSPK